MIESGNAMECFQCDKGEYPGEGWECKKCPLDSFEYKLFTTDEYTCQCKDGLEQHGPTCVQKSDY